MGRGEMTKKNEEKKLYTTGPYKMYATCPICNTQHEIKKVGVIWTCPTCGMVFDIPSFGEMRRRLTNANPKKKTPLQNEDTVK